MKYGDHINGKPALICFVNEWVTLDAGAIARELEGKVQVSVIDINKNRELSQALRIQDSPTFLFYHSGELVQRFLSDYTAQEIINSILTEINKPNVET